MTVAQKIYDFVGLPFLTEIKQWIEINTKGSSSKRKTTYSTNRDSVATMQAWREKLSFEQVSSVQSGCAEVMEQFGYRTVANQLDLVNFNISLIDEGFS